MATTDELNGSNLLDSTLPVLSVTDTSVGSGTTGTSQRTDTPDSDIALRNEKDNCVCDPQSVEIGNEADAELLEAELLEVLEGDLDIDSDEAGLKAKKAAGKKSKSRRKDGGDNSDEEDLNDALSEVSVDSYDVYYATRRARPLNTSALYDLYVKRVKKFHGEMDTKKAPRLVKSFIDYVQDLESRVKELETVAGVWRPGTPTSQDGNNETKAGEGDKSEQKTEEEEPLVREATLETKFYFLDSQLDQSGALRSDVTGQKGVFRSHVDPKHLLRVAYGFEGEHGRAPPKTSPLDELPPGARIWALRIESEPICKFFQTLVDFELQKHNIMEMFAPFRILLRNAVTIGEHLEALEKKFGGENGKENVIQSEGAEVKQANTSENDADKGRETAEPKAPKDAPKPTTQSDSPDPSGEEEVSKDDAAPGVEEKQNDSEPEYETRLALDHFRVLKGFLDKYLGQSLQTYERIKEGKDSKVSFPNLWMLFDAENTIYCPAKRGGPQRLWNSIEDENFETKERQTPQAYRVLATAGGIPIKAGFASQPEFPTALQLPFRYWRLLKKQERESQSQQRMKDKYSNLVVYCYWVDYDTKRWGTVPDAFIFRPFEGEVEITSLEAYPVRKGRLLWDSLKERGHKFIKMTSVSHWAYEGLTVGNPRDREEISSSVIVDTKLAVQNGDVEAPEFKSVKDFWFASHRDEVQEIFKASCSVESCYESGCAEDVYSDIQKKEIEKQDTKLKAFFDEFDQEDSDDQNNTNDVIGQLIEYMETDDLILLLPGVVNGYALRNRKWVQLNLDNLQPVNQLAGWNDLVLPKGHKEMVQAMVEMHAAGNKPAWGVSEKFEVDLVRGKGKGCIILLHGAPGVGKTSTAECVASYTKRPLFPITCGDIGYQHKEVEDNLEKLFGLAHKWGCVLLLDEADVFLAKRNKDDVKRNGLVSVFLRILEYYPGILFLTTNRVGAIDDAFRSRLHLTLYYPPLSKTKSLKIWKMNLRRLKEQNEARARDGRPQIIIEKRKILDYAENAYEVLHWNGRQIRNAFQTALALAEFKAQENDKKSPVIGKDQFKTIAIASEQFDLYLKSTHGMDEERIAQRDRVRVDHLVNPKGRLKELSETDTSDSDSDNGSSSEGESDLSESEPDSSDESSDGGAKRKAKAKAKKGSKKEKKGKEKEKKEKDAKDKKKKKKKDDSDES